jgi:probable HAF family extracellular repeat protein
MKGPELFCAVVALAVIPAVACAQQGYSLVDPSAGSPYDGITLNSINNAGHMAGYGVIASTGEIHALIRRNSTFQDLGLLGYQASDGISINGSDQLAADGIGPGSTALFYSNGNARRIGSIDGGYTSAYSINAQGDIVGSGLNGDGARVGFSWVGGVFHDLSSLGIIRANAINDAGQIVGSSGYYWTYGGYVHGSLHACLYAGGVFTDLGSLTGDPRTNTEALGINGSGQIVGYSAAADGLQHAFLYSAGVMQDLGTFAGENAAAVAINSGGVIIGNLTNPYGANLGAFVYSNGMMSDLASLIVNGADWSQLIVTGINDDGWIVGNGTVNGTTRGFLAVPSTAAAVGSTPHLRTSAILASWPNPFASGTRIPISLSDRAGAGNARLEIFDPSGRRVATLLNERLGPGEHSVAWNGHADGGAAVRSGIYFARLTTQDGSTSRRLVLQR